MRNSPTSVGSRAADTRSTVSTCLDQGQSIVASSFNSKLLERTPRPRSPTPRYKIRLGAARIFSRGVCLDYRRAAGARQEARPFGKAKGKRQKAKVKDESHAGYCPHFCLLPFASCLLPYPSG